MNWIKVSDKLPAYGERVIAKTSTDWVGELRFVEGDKWIRYDAPQVVSIEKLHGEVISWMPMPA